MGVKGRRTHSEAFKADAVRLATESGKTVRQVARDLDLDPGSLHTWIRQQGKRSGDVPPDKPVFETLEDELRRVRGELKRVTEERDFLKKVTAYFAKESK
jgi:transposase